MFTLLLLIVHYQEAFHIHPSSLPITALYLHHDIPSLWRSQRSDRTVCVAHDDVLVRSDRHLRLVHRDRLSRAYHELDQVAVGVDRLGLPEGAPSLVTSWPVGRSNPATGLSRARTRDRYD